MLLLCLILGQAPMRVLFVGNSYTYFNNLPALVQGIANDTPGTPLRAERVTASAFSLRNHWLSGPARARIRGGRWDVVVLQETNGLALTDPRRVEASVRLFDGEVRRSGAVPMVLETWVNRTQMRSQPLATQVYRHIGRTLHDPVAPVGDAWRLWLSSPGAPRLHNADEKHPSFLGSYLAALVVVGRIRGSVPDAPPTDFGDSLGVTHATDGRPFEAFVDPTQLPRLLRCARQALDDGGGNALKPSKTLEGRVTSFAARLDYASGSGFHQPRARGRSPLGKGPFQRRF